jgi:hypothetical protein
VAPSPKKKKNKEGEEVDEEGEDDGVGLSQGTYGVADESFAALPSRTADER